MPHPMAWPRKRGLRDQPALQISFAFVFVSGYKTKLGPRFSLNLIFRQWLRFFLPRVEVEQRNKPRVTFFREPQWRFVFFFSHLGVIPHSHLQDLVWRPRLLLTTLTAPALGQSYCCDSVLAIRTCILYFVRVPQLLGVLNWPKLCLHHIESHLI